MMRERYAMPEDIAAALASAALTEAYLARPPYQRNDYIGWITRAKTPPTRAKRLSQMLAELQAGGGLYADGASGLGPGRD